MSVNSKDKNENRNHKQSFFFPAINYLITNNLVSGIAVPEAQSPGIQNIKLISETFNLKFNILHKNTYQKIL